MSRCEKGADVGAQHESTRLTVAGRSCGCEHQVRVRSFKPENQSEEEKTFTLPQSSSENDEYKCTALIQTILPKISDNINNL